MLAMAEQLMMMIALSLTLEHHQLHHNDIWLQTEHLIYTFTTLKLLVISLAHLLMQKKTKILNLKNYIKKKLKK